jgi:hypothetical protein
LCVYLQQQCGHKKQTGCKNSGRSFHKRIDFNGYKLLIRKIWSKATNVDMKYIENPEDISSEANHDGCFVSVLRFQHTNVHTRPIDFPIHKIVDLPPCRLGFEENKWRWPDAYFRGTRQGV